MGVRGVVAFASPAAKPEGVEQEKEEVQAQTQQRHGAQQQNGLSRNKRQQQHHLKQCLDFIEIQSGCRYTMLKSCNHHGVVGN